VGPATAAALRAAGFSVHLIPARFDSEGVVASLGEEGGLRGAKILFPRAQEGKETIPGELAAAGASVEVVATYATHPDPGEALRLASDVIAGGVDLLTFTAGSAVRSFGSAWTLRMPLPNGVGVVALGPSTAGVLESLGLPADAVASPHTLEGLVAAAESWARSLDRGP
jgi:uroporphyrinogen-III synthase